MPLQEQVIQSRRPIHELVTDSLRDAILTGQLQPGERLGQDEIATSFGVSRIPVREALLKLHAEGLVVSAPHKGYSVVELSVDEIGDIYTIRMELEGLAIRNAVPNITLERLDRLDRILKEEKTLKDDEHKRRIELNREFHHTIYEAANRPRLVAIISNLRNMAESYSPIYLSAPERKGGYQNEHQQIYEACLHGNAGLAENLVQEHLQNILNFIMPRLKSM